MGVLKGDTKLGEYKINGFQGASGSVVAYPDKNSSQSIPLQTSDKSELNEKVIFKVLNKSDKPLEIEAVISDDKLFGKRDYIAIKIKNYHTGFN